MPDWEQITGRCFTPAGLAAYIDGIPSGEWRPRFMIVRKASTATPSPSHVFSGRDRLKNLESFCKNRARQAAGLQLFVTEDLVWVLNAPGLHGNPSNADSGLEIIGNFDTEPTATLTRLNAIRILAAIHHMLGFDRAAIRHFDEEVKDPNQLPLRVEFVSAQTANSSNLF